MASRASSRRTMACASAAQRRLRRGGLHDGEQRRLDDVIDAQAAEGDAVRLAVVESAREGRRSAGIWPLAPVYWTVSLRPQRRQRSRPDSSAAPCLGAPRVPAVGTFSLTIFRIASARPQST